MKVNYKVLDYRPEAEWIAVEFTHPDKPDEPWVEQFLFPDFSKEKLLDHIQALASRIAGSWTRISGHPAKLTIPETGAVDVEPELYLPYEPNPQYEEEPEIDPWTQDLIPGEVESPTQETIPWIVRDLTPEEIEDRLNSYTEQMRQERNWLLLQSDFCFAPDVSLSAEEKQQWATYRKELRDVPQQEGFPKDIVWPVKPGSGEDK